MPAIALREYPGQLGERLERTPPGTSWLDDFRHQAYTDFRVQGLPTLKTEDWKYTNIKGLTAESFADDGADGRIEVPDCGAALLAVMVNGHLDRALSRLDALPAGVTVTGLRELLDDNSSFSVYPFGDIATHLKHPFAAINSAGFRNGLSIDVAPGVRVEDPLIVLWLTGAGQPSLLQPRLLLRLGEESRLTLMEQHLGSGTGHLVNKVGEFEVGNAARMVHLQLQNLSGNRLINGAHVRCGRGSIYRGQSLDLGGEFIRNDLVVTLDGPGGEADVDGLFLSAAGQRVDNHICINHRVPRCRSSALYKGLLGKDGYGVFNGKLIVYPDAEKTDARQVNHNLLLSSGVAINTKPELEIYADDVKCSHGSTTGELDRDQLFYLLSRGIGHSEARGLLVNAFAADIRDRLEIPELAKVIDNLYKPAVDRLIDTRESGEECG